MLKEDKKSLENDLVNVISHKESLEEIVKNYIVDLDENSVRVSCIINNYDKEIILEFFSFEMRIIEKSTFIRNLSKLFSEFMEINLINNQAFINVCQDALNLFILRSTLDSDEIFMIFTKKIMEFIVKNSGKDIKENPNILDFEVILPLIRNYQLYSRL